MHSHTKISKMMSTRNRKRKQTRWLKQNALGLTVSAGVFLGLIGGYVLTFLA